MRVVLLLVVWVSLVAAVDLDTLYINRKDVDSGITKLRAWLWKRERSNLDKDQALNIGVLSGTLYALEIAKEKLDDVHLDEKLRIEYCRLCYHYAVIIAKRMPYHSENGKVVEDEETRLMDWVSYFNGGVVVF
jgi:hypothetical protein